MTESRPPERPVSLQRIAGTAWRAFSSFLEIIGLKRASGGDRAVELSRFKLYHTEFRKLLSANNSFLENMVDLDQKRDGREYFDQSYLKRKTVRVVSDIFGMVSSLNAISSNRYPALSTAFDRIAGALTRLLEDATVSAPVNLVLDLADIQAHHADLVGGKMANLAELRNVLGLPTPDGFAVTTEAYRLLIDEGGLGSWIQNALMDLHQTEDLAAFSEAVRDAIGAVPLPAGLVEAVEAARDRLTARVGSALPCAVRSSAMGEDSELSYAGQFLSLLNVPGEKLMDAYLSVIASLYSSEAIHYRRLHGQTSKMAEMAVGVLGMIPAAASGVVFSMDPADPESEEVIIQSVWGLGVSLVDGRTSPEMIRAPREGVGRTVARTLSDQRVRVVRKPEAGIVEELLPAEFIGRPILNDEQIRTLSKWALESEAHFGSPQDMEWAMDDRGRLHLLQSRPLRLAGSALPRGAPVEGYPLLLDGGETACPGVGSGPAVHLTENDDLTEFPDGGVLVTPRPSPRLICLLRKARAVVTDTGSTTGHMASLTRELRVPALLNTKTATRVIPPGARITVDAGSRFVYLGEIPELIRTEDEGGTATGGDRPVPRPEDGRLLDDLLEHIVPLHLTDPRSSRFHPDHARTLHDLARYVHEKSYEEMFGLGERLGDMRSASYLLDVFLPLDLYIIDLGGGFSEAPKGRKVKPKQIVSQPMSALLGGILDKRIPRFGARPMDLGGFLSVVMRHAMTNPEQDRTFFDPCYALISLNYVNYTARVGYHFSVVDSYCSGSRNKNYISVLFRGGAADHVRRHRRVRAIGAILKHYGFGVDVAADTVIARISKTSLEETRVHLEMVGRLLQFFRQMDAAMTSDQAVEVFKEAFLRDDFDFSRATGSRPTPGGPA